MISHLPALVNNGKSVDNIVSEYYGLKLISDEIFNSIESFSDNGLELSELFSPSQINTFSDSDFQNIEIESLSFAFFGYCAINGDKFQEIDIKEITQPIITREGKGLIFLLDNGYLIENENGKFVITNKFIKVFFENGIFNLEKAKAKERKDLLIEQKKLEKKKIYKGYFDLVMKLYLYIIEIDKPDFKTFNEIRDYIEQKTNGILTLDVYEKGNRGCWDVFIKVKGVTFESDPLRSNISIGYQKGRSKESLEEAVFNFVSWIKESGNMKFTDDVGTALNIDKSQRNMNQ